MSTLSGFFILISICFFIVFLIYNLNSKWAFRVACILILLDPIVNFLRIADLDKDISLLGMLFFTMGFFLVILNRDISIWQSR